MHKEFEGPRLLLVQVSLDSLVFGEVLIGRGHGRVLFHFEQFEGSQHDRLLLLHRCQLMILPML